MITLALMAFKGGSGKSTLTCHIAATAHLLGVRTAVLDLDPQASAYRWGRRRKGKPPSVAMTQAAALADVIEDYEPSYDLLVIDTAPGAEGSARQVAAAVNRVLIPTRPGIMDLDAIQATWEAAQQEGTPAQAVLNACAHNRPALAQAAADRLRRSRIDVNATIIHQRAVYADALISGQTAPEVEPDGKAAREIKDLFEDIFREALNPPPLAAGGRR